MSRFKGRGKEVHDSKAHTGILLTNLGVNIITITF